MKTAEEFLKQYAKDKPIQMFIGDGGGELPNNIRHIASAMEAYKEHCIKSQKSAIPIVSEWVAVDERLPDNLQTVWLSNGKGWTTLGCRAVYDYEGNWCWAEHNGTIYQDEGKIVAECDNEDLDVKFWIALPEPPCR